MARSQKPVVVKLNIQQIEVLDRVVELGDFNGRSHAVRELLLPALEAGVVAMQTQSTAKGTWEYLKKMKRLNKHFEKMARNSTRNAQQSLPGIEPIEIKVYPDPEPA